jgi:hypothetical protein
LAARTGKTRTFVAVGHCILVRVYRMLTTKRPYGELVADYVDRIKADQLTRDFLKRLEQLAVQVTVPNQAHVSALPT